MNPLFVAVSGKKGSGKDELARLINLEIGRTLLTQTTHFADPLKEICIKLFGLDRNLVYGSNADKEQLTSVMWDGFPEEVRLKYSTKSHILGKDPNIRDGCFGNVRNPSQTSEGMPIFVKEPRSGPMTHRELLQVMGTDIFRERVYNNIWAELPFKQKWGIVEDDNWLPTDVVFIADCRFPNEVEETLKHKGIVIRVIRSTGHVDNHPSEIALDNYDFNQPNHFIVDNNGSLDDLRNKARELAILIGAHC